MKRGNEAFTLIEILCVIVIIAILAAMIMGIGALARTMALRKRAQVQVQEIHGAVVEYQVRNGRIPQSLSTIVSMLPVGYTYSNNLPLDPWGVPYQYSAAGDAYRVFSKGPDMATGNATNSADDIELRR